jgi:chromate transporter
VRDQPVSIRDVFLAALQLGLTSFGGPIAHLGFFRREYVDRRGWIDPTTFADLVALCQALPGPASSQLGIAIGTTLAGRWGGLAAWLGFTAPSAVAMLVFAALSRTGSIAEEGWVHGLELAAVAVVAVAVVTMARAGAGDARRAALALGAAVVALAAPVPVTGPLVIVTGAVLGVIVLPRAASNPEASPGREATAGLPRGAVVALAVFAGLLVVLPLVRAVDGGAAALADTFYRSGSLVFGGGHVVLPLLHAGTVDPGWLTDPQFVAGYGFAQAVPGPLFTFAAYLGSVSSLAPNGIVGGLIALGAIFLPSFLVVFGTLPAWARLRADERVRTALDGAGAVVVGLVLAALIDPVATTGLRSWADAGVAAVAALAIASRRVPVVAVVAALAVVGGATA